MMVFRYEVDNYVKMIFYFDLFSLLLGTFFEFRNGEKIDLHFLLVLFPFCCVKKPCRCLASPMSFAMHKEKITAYKNAIYLFVVP